MRKLQPNDAPALARLIHTIWPDDNPDPARIARVSLETQPATLIEEADGQIVGFVYLFPTTAQDGTPRWEIDLLGVHPNDQGRGIGTRLVQVAVEQGRSRGAKIARALIRIGNTASMHTFQRCGFTPDPTICDLYTAEGAGNALTPVPPGIYLIPVETLTYHGAWLEGEFSIDALRDSRENSRGNIGVLIPTGSLPAEQAGFEHTGQFQWVSQIL